VGIPLVKIKEGCCDSDLSQFTIIDGDELDYVGSTCDKIIECSDKYILVEEKSIIFAFLNNCCKENKIDLDANYKFTTDDIKHINVTKIIDEVIRDMDINIKKRILSDTIVDMISSSAKKASNTTDLLNKRFDATKTADMTIFYLYCNSGKPIDRIMSNWLSRYKTEIFIECNALKNYLIQR